MDNKAPQATHQLLTRSQITELGSQIEEDQTYLTPHWQVVIDAIRTEELPTKELRTALADHGVSTKPAAFHLLLGRMIDEQLVEASLRTQNVNGTITREKVFCVTKKGLVAHYVANKRSMEAAQRRAAWLSALGPFDQVLPISPIH